MDGMRLRLQKLQEEDDQAQKIRAEKLELESWEDFEGVLLHQGHFGIEKTCELVARKYCWETLRRDVDVSLEFVTGLPISTDWEGNSYDLILVIVDWLIKMVHYEPVQITIDAPALAAGYTPFELNCGYHPRISYEKDLDPRSRSNAADKLADDLTNLMSAFRENLQHWLDIVNPFPPDL